MPCRIYDVVCVVAEVRTLAVPALHGRGVRVGPGAEEVGGALVPDALNLPPLTAVPRDPVLAGGVLGQQVLIVGGGQCSRLVVQRLRAVGLYTRWLPLEGAIHMTCHEKAGRDGVERGVGVHLRGRSA